MGASCIFVCVRGCVHFGMCWKVNGRVVGCTCMALLIGYTAFVKEYSSFLTRVMYGRLVSGHPNMVI